MSFIENCTIVLVWKNVLGIQIWWTVPLKVLFEKHQEAYFQYNIWSITDRKLTNDSISIIKLEDNLVPVPF